MNVRPIRAILIIVLTLMVFMHPLPVNAQTVGFTFSTVITYQNVGTETAHVTVLYYPEGQSTPISIPRPDLPTGASASVSVGSLGSPSGFRGAAVVKSDVPLAVLTTQVPSSTTIKARPMASGFAQGTSDVWFLALYKSPAFNSTLSIQNLDSAAANLKLTFYGGATPVVITRNNVSANGSIYLRLADLTELGTSYSGAVHVEATRLLGGAKGKVAGIQLDSSTDGITSQAVESINQLGTKLYMPYAICSGLAGMSTTYYVFNSNETTASTITVRYSSGKVDSRSLAPLTGGWFHACSPSGTVTGYSGYANITSSASNIMAVGLIKNGGMSAIYSGQAVGTSRIALPYANYSTAYFGNGQRQRTTISVMNLGGSLAAGAVKVHYYDKNGTLIGTHSLPALSTGVKVDSNAALSGKNGVEFGYYTDGSTGGSAMVEGPVGSNLMATGWVVSNPSTGKYAGETYNGIPQSVGP